MYKKTTFQMKSRKRMLEDRLTDIKIAYTAGQAPGYAISLTGPAVYPHIDNYSRLGVKGLLIAENDYNTYRSIDKDVKALANNTHIAVHYKDVKDVVLGAFMSKIAPIIDIDLDFTATQPTVMSTINTVLKRISSNIGREALGKRFTLVVTFCQRGSGRDSINTGLDTIKSHFNQDLNFNLERVYRQSYADGAPMATAMYLVHNLTNPKDKKIFTGSYDDIEPLLITNGKRQFP